MILMTKPHHFTPPRRKGTLVHLLLIAFFASTGAFGFWQTARVRVAVQLVPYLLLILGSLILLPLLAYRLYALHRSFYNLERGGVRLQWGWRREAVPMSTIDWVHHTRDLENPPRPPRIRWPGAVIGVRSLGERGLVEFFASRSRDLIVVAAGGNYYVLSPSQTDEFLHTYRELTELGSLTTIPPQTQHPTFLLSEIQSERAAFILLSLGLVLNLTLLIWTTLVIPRRPTISLGFTSQGLPYPPLESIRLILLPIINFSSYLGNFVLGLFLYQRSEAKTYAHLLWGGSVLVGLLFHIGLYYILG